MSQAGLGKLVGVSGAAIHYLEIGRTIDPGINTLKGIAEALGAQLTDIVKPAHPPTAVTELRDNFLLLSPEQQQVLLVTVRQLAEARKKK